MWLIAGGDSQLGRCLGELLAASDVPHLRMPRRELDVTDIAGVRRAFDGLGTSVVVNVAAWTAVDAAEDDPDGAHAVNHIGARNLAIVAREHSSLLVQISTDYVFDGRSHMMYQEDSPTCPVSVYGRSKLAGETAAREEHPDGTYVVRTAWLYSRHGRNFAKTMVRRALADDRVTVVDDQFGQPTSAPDLAAHLIDLVGARVPTGVYHGTNSGVATWHDLATEIFRLCGRDPALVSPCPTAGYPTAAPRPPYSVLGHRRTVESGLAAMRDWMSALEDTLPGVIAEVNRETR
jgi:dTDP-4-dehydrorhamnose reductase